MLEGGSYTEPALEGGMIWDGTLARSRFWDPGLLATNDDVFYYPTAANVATFTRRHGARWLVAVDWTPSPDPAVRRPLRARPDLARYAVAGFRAGEITVYSVRWLVGAQAAAAQPWRGSGCACR